jgi:hypothetical protein
MVEKEQQMSESTTSSTFDEDLVKDLQEEIREKVMNRKSVEEAVEKLRRICADISSLEEAERRFRESIEQPGGRSFPTLGTEKTAWYPGPDPSDTFWPRMERYLQDPQGKNWDRKTVESIDETSTEVLRHLDNPRETSFRTQGLVLGHVQSGKTANFAALAAKAADSGFRFIIVFSGVTTMLRTQTQERLYKDLTLDQTTDWFTVTNLQQDYAEGPIPLGTALAHANQPGHACLAVIKKHHVVLENLLTDLRVANAALTQCPVLIIDDECDQASVNPRRPGDPPAPVNRLIRDIIAAIPRCSYVGYTATPHANVLIDSDPDLQDLYPSDFIIALPKPDQYFGAAELFGIEDGNRVEDGYDMIRRVEAPEVPLLVPSGRGDHITFQPQVVPTLRNAIRYFICATACRVKRGQDHRHSSMLVHSDLHTLPHDRMRDRIEEFVDEVKDRWSKGDPAERMDFRKAWENEDRLNLPVPSGNPAPSREPWSDLEPLIQQVLDSIKFVVENSRAQPEDRIQFPDEIQGTTGKKSIIVGGNTLARGLTIEGLVVSHFVRRSNLDDNLMQMGRWFGYRIGYEDLPRIWMPDNVRNIFMGLALQEEETRVFIERFAARGLNPVDLKVPMMSLGGGRRPTSRIGAGTHGRNLSDRTRQSTHFLAQDAGWLKKNWEAGSTLLDDCGVSARQVGEHHAFDSVNVEYIKTFLEEYSIHEAHDGFGNQLLLAYIDSQIEYAKQANEPQYMDRWNVVVVGKQNGNSSSEKLGPIQDVKTIDRTRLTRDGDVTDIGVLLDRAHLVVDIRSPGSHTNGPTSWPAARAERQAIPAPPLLLLYPIDKDSAPRGSGRRRPLEAERDVLAVGFHFPLHDRGHDYWLQEGSGQ